LPASPVEVGSVTASQHCPISRCHRRHRLSVLEVLPRRSSSWPAVVARWRLTAVRFIGGAAFLGRPWRRGREPARGVFLCSSGAALSLAGRAVSPLLLLRLQRRWSDSLGGGALLAAWERLGVLLRRLAVAGSAAPSGIQGVGHHSPASSAVSASSSPLLRWLCSASLSQSGG
jgi:hypothetical protein